MHELCSADQRRTLKFVAVYFRAHQPSNQVRNKKKKKTPARDVEWFWNVERSSSEVLWPFLVAVRYLDTGFVEISKCNEFLIDFKYVAHTKENIHKISSGQHIKHRRLRFDRVFLSMNLRLFTIVFAHNWPSQLK